MDRRPQRRRVPRLSIPSQFSGPGLREQAVRLLDLSREGPRIEHARPVPNLELCFLTLPTALGGSRLQGEVIWSRLRRRKRGPTGLGPIYHQSGLSFLLLTPTEQDALAGALKRLKAGREPPPSPARGGPGPQGVKGAAGRQRSRQGVRREQRMIERPEQRRVERLNVPRHCWGAGRGAKLVHLVDLSPAGARIEHSEPLEEWSGFPLELPRPLGGGRVQAEVIWSHLAGRQRGSAGTDRLVYQSGLAFPHRTPAEQASLQVALVRSAGEWALRLFRDLRWQAEREPARQAPFDALCGEALGWLRREIEGLRFTKVY